MEKKEDMNVTRYWAKKTADGEEYWTDCVCKASVNLTHPPSSFPADQELQLLERKFKEANVALASAGLELARACRRKTRG